uniref:Uncharacterized protein n=5 Tax=Lygus hesperus TaxID=30085 RepID=A0A0A9Y773_LYGHE
MHPRVTGHNDIKRLKRENEHLRREIWTLREELYRIEHERVQEEEEEEDGDEDEETEEEEAEDEEGDNDGKEGERSRESDKLSTVNEEPEDYSSVLEASMPSPPRSPSVHQVEVRVEEPRRIPLPVVPPIRVSDVRTSTERRVEEYKPEPSPCLRINSVHPFTAAASVDPHILPNLSVCEVIEEVSKKCKGIVGVRMLHRSVFLSCANRQSLDELLAVGLTLRDTPMNLHDVSQGTVVVALSGVPHHLSDADLAQVLAQYGPVISGVERRLYRDVDTGERLARLRPVSSIPKRVFIQGSEVLMRPLNHEELSKLSIQSSPPKPNLQLKIDTSGLGEGSGPPTQGSSSSMAPRSELLFPTSSTTSINSLHPQAAEERQCHSAPPMGGPPSSPLAQVKKGHSDTEVKKERPRIRRVSRKMSRQEPSSSSEQESPNKPRRRRSSVFAPPGYAFETRDRSASLSSRASVRRKLSVTGRETGKIPWCACWGNGCI